MIIVDRKYISLLSNRLERFTRKSDRLFNCRCPLCGDSKHNKIKTRGYLYERKGTTLYYCHNCGASMSFNKFLKTVDPLLYKEYTQETFLAKHDSNHNVDKQPDITKFSRPQFLKDSPLKELKKISQIDWRHPAKAYVDKRMLPSASHHKLFYAPKFKTWVNSFIPEKFKFDKDEPRLIIPFLDEEKNCFGFQGRAFLDVGPRYITIMLDDTKPKVFGLDSVDMTKRFYITEGPIDSLFLPNAIAMAGADLNISWIDKNNRKNAVFVYDNEPRNKDIIKRMEKVIELGHNICIWPASMIQKDINDMVLAGHSAADVQRLIDKHACEGLEAKLALMMWRKV